MFSRLTDLKEEIGIENIQMKLCTVVEVLNANPSWRVRVSLIEQLPQLSK